MNAVQHRAPRAVEPGPEKPKIFHMPLFRPGAMVRYQQRQEQVSHVVVRRFEMRVYLVGHENPVNPDDLEATPSLFTTERMP